jgi:hypothetical protein
MAGVKWSGDEGSGHLTWRSMNWATADEDWRALLAWPGADGAGPELRHTGTDRGAHHRPRCGCGCEEAGDALAPLHPDDFTPGGRAWRQNELINLEIKHRWGGP